MYVRGRQSGAARSAVAHEAIQPLLEALDARASTAFCASVGLRGCRSWRCSRPRRRMNRGLGKGLVMMSASISAETTCLGAKTSRATTSRENSASSRRMCLVFLKATASKQRSIADLESRYRVVGPVGRGHRRAPEQIQTRNSPKTCGCDLCHLREISQEICAFVTKFAYTQNLRGCQKKCVASCPKD